MDIMMTVPIWWIASQSAGPDRNSTGRGTPVTAGFAMRGETAPARAWTATAATTAARTPRKIHTPIDAERFGVSARRAADGNVCSVVIASDLAEPGDTVRVD